MTPEHDVREGPSGDGLRRAADRSSEQPGELLSFSARRAAWLQFARVQFTTLLTYRTDFFFMVAILLLQIFLLRVVWTALYADDSAVEGGGGVGQIALSEQLAYVSLAAVQFWLFHPWLNHLPRRIYEGKIAVDLVRPVGLPQQTIAGYVGTTMALFPFALLALPFGMLIAGVATPASPAAFAGYLGATVVAYAISVLMTTIIGLTAFWTMDVVGFSMVFRLVAQVMSGALVPLWFMPDWMRTLAEVLPFQATTYSPVAIYLGKIAGWDIVATIGLQLLWVAVLWAVVMMVWRRAIHRVVVQGG